MKNIDIDETNKCGKKNSNKSETVADLCEKISISRFIIFLVGIIIACAGTIYAFGLWTGNVNAKLIYTDTKMATYEKSNISIEDELKTLNKQLAEMNATINTRLGRIEGKMEK